ncbi:MAG: hypothetical protein J5J06_12375 [Phycisphaerae bacterium]|nr:hypothetical protein [Phycisphaerae bacterium]
MFNAATTPLAKKGTHRRVWLIRIAPGLALVVLLHAISFIPTPALTFSRWWKPLGQSGEYAISMYRGLIYVQYHAYLGIGRAPTRLSDTPSWQTWKWYHRLPREKGAYWRRYFYRGRPHGDFGYWYFHEISLHRFPLILSLPPLVVLSWLTMTAAGLFKRYARAVWMENEIEQRRSLGYCLNCGYDLRGNVSGICPECGTRVLNSPTQAAVSSDEPDLRSPCHL